MRSASYHARRDQLTTYFDQTAAAAWEKLTSTDPVGRIRATVRAGRDEMRKTLLDWLPRDLSGQSLLDAGCGTGSLAIEAAERGARVVAVDVAANLVDIAKKRVPEGLGPGTVEFRVGDMLRTADESFDHVVAMDSLIHYSEDDVLAAVAALARSARRSVLFTSAPWTPLLAAMHVVGRMIPHRHHRAPAIVPVRTERLAARIDTMLADGGWRTGRTRRVASGFYISQAIEVRRPCAD